MGMALDEPQENEETIPADGLDILVADDKVKTQVSGSTLDWAHTLRGEGFVLIPEKGAKC